jgi:CRP-like cAMP-binding protein
MKQEFKDLYSKLIPPSYTEEDVEKAIKITTIIEVPSKTILLSAGDMATNFFLVLKGCLRGYYIKENGKEITAQFFLEGQGVLGIESMILGAPSKSYIDALEDSILGVMKLEDYKKFLDESPRAKDHFHKVMLYRFIYYINHQASFLLDNPEERYRKFVQNNPGLDLRLPKQYIASYLGMTPVSLSRIRTRLKNDRN